MCVQCIYNLRVCTWAGGPCVYVCSVPPTYFSKGSLNTDSITFLTISYFRVPVPLYLFLFTFLVSLDVNNCNIKGNKELLLLCRVALR